jgi:hypothetical protein
LFLAECRCEAEAAGNDTANPSGTLNLLYPPGNSTPAETGLAVNRQGLFTVAAGQTFPGAGTITGVTAGLGLIGGGTNLFMFKLTQSNLTFAPLKVMKEA